MRDAKWNPEKLAEPLRWRKPRRVLVNSMSDLFGEGVPFEFIAAVFGVMAASPRHTFQIITKRPQRMLEWFRWRDAESALGDRVQPCCWQPVDCWTAASCLVDMRGTGHLVTPTWPLPNVWLGVSCEDQQRADERIPDLLECPAAIRFVSLEPLLGPINITPWLSDRACPNCRDDAYPGSYPDFCRECDIDEMRRVELVPKPRIDWVITGAESGPGARPAELDWFRSIRDQCVAAGVPFFLKQADVCQECSGRGKWQPVFDAPQPCATCNGTGRTGKVRKGCPSLDGRVWDQMPRLTAAAESHSAPDGGL